MVQVEAREPVRPPRELRARTSALELKADEMIDIADEPIEAPAFDANGNLKPGSMSVSDQLRLREMRIKILQWQIKRLDPRSDR